MSDNATSRHLVVFSLGDGEYALPVTQVREVIRFTEPRDTASGTDTIRGVISLRDREIPICDLAARLGVESDEAEARKILIVDSEPVAAGVMVDEVGEVLEVDDGQLRRGRSGSGRTGTIASVDDRSIAILNTQRIFSGIDLEAAVAA